MANTPTHLLAGGGLAVGLYAFNKRFIRKEELTPEGLVGSFCLGAAGGVFADILEPATSPNHREFFHSITFAAILIIGKDKVYEALALDREARRYFDWFLLSYGSHLVLDARTTKGLPII